MTVFQSGDNASCAYPTVNSSGLITGHEQQRTVTQTGPTVTIFYTVSPSTSRSSSTTFGLSQDTSGSNSLSTASAESTASSISSPPIVANATDLQQQSTSSDPFVTAQVVKPEDNPPIAPNTNDTFLLVTFGNNGTSATSAGSLRKRQSSDQALVYNATQSFAAITGGIYNLSAAAASAPYGSSPPNCAITICGDSTCGPRSQLSTSFAEYSFTWTSPATQNSVATFSIQCAGQAYVALTNVTVTPIYIPQPTYSTSEASAASSGAGISSSYRFEPTREVTTTAYGTRTEYITATTSAWYTFTTEGAPRTITTTYGQTSTLTFTEPASTYITSELIYSTLISSYVVTTTQDRTRYRNLTYTQPATTIYPSPSILTQTDVLTSFLPGFNHTLTTTYISTELSIAYSTGITTLYITSTSIPPPVTLNASTVVQTQDPLTVVFTSLVPTTFYVTSTFETSIVHTTTLAQPTLTETFLTTAISTYVFSLTSTLPQATTVFYSTLTTTSRLPGNTSYLVATEIQTLTSILPPTTIILYSTVLSELPASSITQTETSSLFLTDTTYITQTLDPETFTSISLSILPASTAYITSTLPPSTAYFTYTTISDRIITESTFLPASTITETSLKPPSTFYVTRTSVLPASTVLVTSTLPRETFTPERATETTSLPQLTTTEVSSFGVTEISSFGVTETTSLPGLTTTEVSSFGVTETFSLPQATLTLDQITTTAISSYGVTETTSLPQLTTTAISTLLETTSLPRGTETRYESITQTLPAEMIVSTLLETTSLPRGTETRYESITQTLISTLLETTSLPRGTETQYENITQTLAAETIFSTLIETTSLPRETFTLPASTFVSTFVQTISLPGETQTQYSTGTATLTLPASTVVSTYNLTETATSIIQTTLPASTVVSTYSLTETTSLPRGTETATSIIQTTLPASTVVTTYSLTETTSLPRGTETATSIIRTTLPASTYVSTFRLTETATSVIQTTLPASTEYSTKTETFTLPASTVVSTFLLTATTSLPPGTETATSIIQTTLPASTEYSTGTETLTLPASTIVSTFRLTETTSLPRGTETTSLPAGTETATSIVQTTLPASTMISTLRLTETTSLPAGTETTSLPARNKFHHGNLHAAAADYDNGFYTSRIDGCQYILQHDSTPDFHRARNEYASSRDKNHRLHTSPGHDNSIFNFTSIDSSQHSYLNSSSSNEHAATTTRERTQTVTAYTTLEASTYTSTVYSTVQTTEVQTQVSTMPASSIYVTYTTTVQGQVQTVTFTYTPTTSTPGALLVCLAHGINRHYSNCVCDIQLFYLFYSRKQSGYKYKQLKYKQPCICHHDHNYDNNTTNIVLKFSKNVALRTPTVVAGSTTSATANVDDALFTVNMPFAVSLYGVASTTITVSSNGILAVASPVTTAYNNAALPQYSVCGTGLLAFWDDLIINSGRTQGIFWSSEGKPPSRSITFEFYESKYQAPDTYAHFLVSFWENLPGIATIDFLNITDGGVSATVGGQSQAANLYAQYSFNQAVINNGLLITLNSTTNSWYTGYPPGIFAMPGAIYS
ncbi:hypothetical protein KC354_g11875 [Hortaea werneckii]|nr:hypothetical protein KC354_g11875 [Hortaea werneckii]